MNYSRPMIDLVYEIRRRIPSELKPSIKLANPELLSELTEFVNKDSKDIVLHALVRELLTPAGEEWISQLDQEDAEEAPRTISKLYRGSVQLEAAPTTSDVPPAGAALGEVSAKKPVRIYRGQIIED